MNINFRRIFKVILAATVLCQLNIPTLRGQEFAIPWSNIPGSAGVHNGGIYSVTGSIDWHGAARESSGGQFTLAGGFWSIYAVPTKGAALLTIVFKDANTARISWPSPSIGWALQQTSDLGSGIWVTPAETVLEAGGMRYIEVGPMSGNRFYRLHQADTWTRGAENPLAIRLRHSAVWTGKEMIIWGGAIDVEGRSPFADGALYNPTANTWKPMTSAGAAPARSYHTAIWTGTEMIIWGGHNTQIRFNEGGRYNPATDTWRSMSSTGAPAGRTSHTVVWTGSEMIVWGGHGGEALNNGARYNPATDTWTELPITGTASPRYNHTAVWTGKEMIIWGGRDSAGGMPRDGARYDFANNKWFPVSLEGAPGSRFYHSAVWAGTEMIVWGGNVGGYESVNDGARYNPLEDKWTPLPLADAPSRRWENTVVWTGHEMIIWGGYDRASLRTGARYNPISNRWKEISPGGAPSVRQDHTAIWTGGEMILWGGGFWNGFATEALNDTWSFTPGN